MHVHACAQTHAGWMIVTPLKSHGKIHFNYLLITILEKRFYPDFVIDIKKDIRVLLTQDET